MLTDCLKVSELAASAKYRTDKFSHHKYGRIYDEIFSRFRHDAFALLEIGVDEGASLSLWHDYFHKATIYGIDTVPGTRACDSKSRIVVFTGNQHSVPFLSTVLDAMKDPPRVVIDDGSHYGKDQLVSFETIFPRMTPGGFYIIEDLNAETWEQWQGQDFEFTEHLSVLARKLAREQLKNIKRITIERRIVVFEKEWP